MNISSRLRGCNRKARRREAQKKREIGVRVTRHLKSTCQLRSAPVASKPKKSSRLRVFLLHSLLEGLFDFFDFEGLDDVAFLELGVAFEADTALEAFLDVFGVVLEALET